jgi:hypothetical protein
VVLDPELELECELRGVEWKFRVLLHLWLARPLDLIKDEGLMR